MNVAFGFKAHSGWAALVVIGKQRAERVVVDRRRVELVDEPWAKQPYHAAEGKPLREAREIVERGVESARRVALREMQAAARRERERGNEVSGCAVLTGSSMPEWDVEEILAAHFRLHKAEGVLFRDALMRAASAAGLKTVPIPEKGLIEHAESSLRIPWGSLVKEIAALGKAAGSPWGRDQKDAAVAALIALEILNA